MEDKIEQSLNSQYPEQIITQVLSSPQVIQPGDSLDQQVPPPPLPEDGGNFQFTFPSLLENEQKNYQDILDLKRSGVSIEIIARVKGVSVVELVQFMHSKKIPLDLPEIKHPAPVAHTSSVQNETKKARKRKKSWKKEDFPSRRVHFQYYCADCRKENKSYSCSCGRKCWKFCNKCERFYSNHHGCFRKTKKRKRTWKPQQFPKEHIGEFYCGDCQKVSATRSCECDRDCWCWCGKCNKYCAKHHFTTCDGGKGQNLESSEKTNMNESLCDCTSFLDSIDGAPPNEKLMNLPPPPNLPPPISQGNSGSDDPICEDISSLVNSHPSTKTFILTDFGRDLLLTEQQPMPQSRRLEQDGGRQLQMNPSPRRQQQQQHQHHLHHHQRQNIHISDENRRINAREEQDEDEDDDSRFEPPMKKRKL